MATKFSSFDASPLGDSFCRSRGGAMNAYPELHGVIFLRGCRFSGQSKDYYTENPEAAEEDLTEWNVLLSQERSTSGIVAQVSTDNECLNTLPWHPDVPWPRQLTRMRVIEHVPDIDPLHDAIRARRFRRLAVQPFILDTFSLVWDDLEGGITDLLDELDDDGWKTERLTWNDRTIRWLRPLTEALRANINWDWS